MSGREGGYWSVIRASEGDVKPALSAESAGVGGGVIDVDDLCFTSSKALVGVVGWIKAPGSISVDGQASDGVANEGVGEAGLLRGTINVGGGEGSA